MSFIPEEKISCFGYCSNCRQEHSLPFGRSLEYARGVMEAFRTGRRLDYEVPESRSNPALGFDVILPGDRGHMFGVMECLNQAGETEWLRAFSSLSSGIRDISGWSSYLVGTDVFDEVILPKQQEIKKLTAMRNELSGDDPKRVKLEAERRQISRELMPRIHDLYTFRNFRNETRSLRELFPKNGGIPGGVGDCCAPKLLNEAVLRGLKPISVAEFYWGGTNQSGRKQPGQFFEACAEKCQPILGFMLCGLETMHE